MKRGYGKDIEALETAGCKILYKPNEFAAMMDEIEAGDVLVVCSLKDLSEYLPEFLKIAGSLKEGGIGFISLLDEVDTTKYQGIMLYNLLGALSELKVEINRGAGRKPAIDKKAFAKDVKKGMSLTDLATKYNITRMSAWRNQKAIGQQ